jgi:hypothetical protein
MSEEKIVNIKLKGKTVDQLEDLKERTCASTSAEVVKNALRIYKTIEAYKDTDSSIIIEHSDGKRVKIIIP